MDDVVDAFVKAITTRGLKPERLEADGRMHRCGTEKRPRSKNGVYCLHLDGKVPAGWFQNHEDGEGVTTWRAERVGGMSEAERSAWRLEMKRRQMARDAERQTLNLTAARRAAFIWDRTAPIPANHPYLTRKRVQAHGARLHRGLIVVPLHNAVGGMVNLQFIAPDGAKKFLKDGEKRGCFFTIGEPDNDPDALIIGEGFATMASINEMTGDMCVVAFDCGNLRPVAEIWRKKLPRARIVISADLDKAGIASAKEVLKNVSNCHIAVPEFEGATG